MNFHDIFREWTDNNAYDKNNYQYNFGVKLEMPLFILNKKIFATMDFQRQTVSSHINNNDDFNISAGRMVSYSLNSSFLLNDDLNKYGIRIKYSGSNNTAGLVVNNYPEDKSNMLASKYFYDLLEPAFGHDINFYFSGNDIGYAFEYCRTVTPSFNAGINVCQEIYNYNPGINYFSSVEKISGEKRLDGLLYFNRFTLGLSSEYKITNFIFRSSISYSIPYFKLNINQQNPVSSDNIILEILNLANGTCNGHSITGGAGVSYQIKESMSADFGMMLFGNNYSGNIKLSSPVLGYEIIPIVHQLNFNFDDNMKNYLFTLCFNHKANNYWNYSIGIDYLHSINDINYNYKVMTEFGIGHGFNQDNYNLILDIYKLNLNATFNIINNVAIKLSFNQYIPVVYTNNNDENKVRQPAQSTSGTASQIVNNWGGSIYGLAIKYNFN
jgi:hypothetical protein